MITIQRARERLNRGSAFGEYRAELEAMIELAEARQRDMDRLVRVIARSRATTPREARALLRVLDEIDLERLGEDGAIALEWADEAATRLREVER